jgi:two-component system chemotaxis response regulator CheY
VKRAINVYSTDEGVVVAKTVILVDDSKTILATAEMALEELQGSGSVTLKTYQNPAELLDLLTGGSEDFDLLISDINMPQMNGLDLAQTLKADDRFKNKPILILTTESSPAMKERGKEIGVTGWMVKPFSDEKLIKAVKMVLGI